MFCLTSKDLFSCELTKELVIINLSRQLLIIAFNKRLQLLIRYVQGVVTKETAKILFVNEAIFARIYQIKRLMCREIGLLLRQDPQLFGLDLVLQVCCPGLQEKLSRLRVEDLTPRHG